MDYMSDLALERCVSLENGVDGVEMERSDNGEVTVTLVRILTDAAAGKIGKPVGEYYTLEMTRFPDDAPLSEKRIEAVSAVIKKFLPPEGTILVAGIGNADMTSDALGPMTASGVFATRYISGNLKNQLGFECDLRSVASVSTGVLGKTGIESGEFIKCICSCVNPGAVIAVDALAASAAERLGTTVQICNTGISPGAGVGNKRERIDEELLGVPVISIGVPTVADIRVFTGENTPEALVVAPKDIDVLVKNAASLLSFSLNRALQPGLTSREIYSLS